jgi:hypothetical protein
MKKTDKLLFMAIFAALASACSIRTEITLDSGGGINVSAAAVSDPNVAALLDGAGSSLWGGGNPFDSDRIRVGLLSAGFSSARVSGGTGMSFRADAGGPSARAVFAALNSPPDKPALNTGVVTFQAAGSGDGLFVVVFSPETLPAILSVLPPESADYLDLVLSPEITGMPGGRQMYLDNMAAVYGQALADALAASVVEFIFTAPADITGFNAPPWVKSGKTGPKTVRFIIPLPDLIAGTDRKVFTVRWR